MDSKNIILSKSKAFAIRIIKLNIYLQDTKKEYVLSKQLLRSGTSIGANVREGVNAFSKADFVFKMNIALKEACETEYWLELLNETGYLTDNEFFGIYRDCNELSKLLTSIVKSSKAISK